MWMRLCAACKKPMIKPVATRASPAGTIRGVRFHFDYLPVVERFYKCKRYKSLSSFVESHRRATCASAASQRSM